MRLIGNLENRRQAEQFAAFLKTEGITAQLELEGNEWEIWVKEEDQFKPSLALFKEFSANPDDAKFKGVIEKARALVREEEKKRARVQKNIVKVAPKSTTGKTPLTILVIGICALVALLTNFGDTNNITSPVRRAMSFTAVDPGVVQANELNKLEMDNMGRRLASINRGEVWRIITPIFVHIGVLHIVFNMIWFFQFGQLIEGRYGTVWLAILILVTAAASNFVQGVVPLGIGGSGAYNVDGYLINGFGGMSGVLYGLFGYIWMKSLFDPDSRFFMPQSTVLILVGWFLLCIIDHEGKLLGLNVANWAHGIGLLVGLAIGYGSSMLKR